MTVGLPAAIPVIIPVAEPAVAFVISLLLQIPPPASVNVVAEPTHTEGVPLIPDGNGFTVTGVDIEQPVAVNTNIIFGIPDDKPVTMPVAEPTVARPVLLLDQEPDPDGSLKVVFSPAQTWAIPVIADGRGLTVKGTVAVHPVASV